MVNKKFMDNKIIKTRDLKKFYDYFSENEKSKDEMKIGAEFEHIIVQKDSLETASYYEPGGIETILYEIKDRFNWQGIFESKRLIGLKKNGERITLEPAGQFELALAPEKCLQLLELKYLDILNKIISILEEYNLELLAIGYQPFSKISNLSFVPKKRYEIMSKYLRNRGKNALNMMKGTAATQVAIDYTSEEDFIRKMQLAYRLSPIFSLLFDNSLLFSGKLYTQNALRRLIWNNCDAERCGILPTIFSKQFGYEKYGEYTLSIPPIFYFDENENMIPYKKPAAEIFNDQWSNKQLEHLLSMHFTDVRARRYIEIRMADAIPYPCNFSLLALIKVIFYNKNLFSHLENLLKDVTLLDLSAAYKNIIIKGFDTNYAGKTVDKLADELINKTIECAECSEKRYLLPLKMLRKKFKNLKDKFHTNLNEDNKDAAARLNSVNFIYNCQKCVNHCK